MSTQLLLFENRPKSIDVNEAPKGYYPISKYDASTPNVCSNCDWRKQCVANIDNACTKYPCTSYKRNDGIGVIFKLIV